MFIAIIPSDLVLDEIGKAIKIVKTRLKQPIKFEPREKWHITLVFLGEQGEETIPKVREALEVALNGFEYKPFSTADIVFAPPLHEPRMIWLTLSDNASQYLAELRARLVKELQTRGVVWKDEVRAFHGHITLAKFPTRPAEDFGPLKCACANRCDKYGVELMTSETLNGNTTYASILRMAQE